MDVYFNSVLEPLFLTWDFSEQTRYTSTKQYKNTSSASTLHHNNNQIFSPFISPSPTIAYIINSLEWNKVCICIIHSWGERVHADREKWDAVSVTNHPITVFLRSHHKAYINVSLIVMWTSTDTHSLFYNPDLPAIIHTDLCSSFHYVMSQKWEIIANGE